MSNSISTLLTAIFTTCSVKTTLRVGARLSTRSSPKIAYSTTPAGASTVAATRLIACQAPAYAGTDFIIARDGRIAALYLFFDKLP
jgi:outer membrane receptor for Fe3+-dicitrate